MSQPYRPSPPPWRPPPPKPPISGTATAALTVAALSIPLGFFGLFWIPAVAAFGSPALAIAVVAAFVLAPLILGYAALREIREGKAHPISRQRGPGHGHLRHLRAARLGVLIQWATGG